MTATATGKSLSLGAILAAVGGIAAAVGAVLVWESVTIGSTLAQALAGVVSVNGIDGNGGKIILVLGVVAIVLAGVKFLGIQLPVSDRNLDGLIAVVGVLIVIVAVLNVFSMQDDLNKFNQSLDQLKALGQDVSGTSAGMGIGIILALVGGVVVVAGGALGMFKKA